VDAAALRDDLARQDAAAAAALAQVDALTDACAALAAREAATRALLDDAPEEERRRSAELAHARDELAGARREVEQANAALAAAEAARSRDETRIAAARRHHDHALATQQVAEQHEARLVRRLADHRHAVEAARLERELLLARARELAQETRGVPRLSGRAPITPSGVDGLAEWASSLRAALLVARSGLAAERDALLRQLAELQALTAPPS
jgi:chromosome segregation ATPase